MTHRAQNVKMRKKQSRRVIDLLQEIKYGLLALVDYLMNSLRREPA